MIHCHCKFPRSPLSTGTLSHPCCLVHSDTSTCPLCELFQHRNHSPYTYIAWIFSRTKIKELIGRQSYLQCVPVMQLWAEQGAVWGQDLPPGSHLCLSPDSYSLKLTVTEWLGSILCHCSDKIINNINSCTLTTAGCCVQSTAQTHCHSARECYWQTILLNANSLTPVSVLCN